MPSDFTITEAAEGLRTWAKLPRDEGGLGLDHREVGAWYPTEADIDTASGLGYTWAFTEWLAETGSSDIEDIHETLDLRPEIDTRIAGLYRYATEQHAAGNPAFADYTPATFAPTLQQIEAAHAAGYTWSFDEWSRRTNQRGLAGIQTALDHADELLKTHGPMNTEPTRHSFRNPPVWMSEIESGVALPPTSDRGPGFAR